MRLRILLPAPIALGAGCCTLAVAAAINGEHGHAADAVAAAQPPRAP
jgi:hypothetical protein